jgi:hypothetical protein
MSLKTRLAAARKRLAARHARDEALHQRIDHNKDVIRDLKKEIVARKKPLRELAYVEACKLVGIMEHGGNNQGTDVMRIIRENGGTGPEPWCGDTMAYCYRHAGSKGVDRSWASVSLTGSDPDVRRTLRPLRGDLVRYNFDHIGMFVRDLGNGYIETIEGNTGASGAVSDSTTGGDGVYRKQRSKSLVRDYLEVLR